ncbi:MAG: hypothetical protein OEX04_01440 [Acidimicrobiia bacterium]|nr:hypothetical protein [Acidimicrobiia bacterium]MDH5295466.1 hypothetical protein [Acidimicrobiia bacterium]
MPAASRPLLGVFALAAVCVAAVSYWVLDSATSAGIALRSAFLLGALWLAWPEFTERSMRRLVIIGGLLAMLLLRPRAAWVLIPAIGVWSVMRKD